MKELDGDPKKVDAEDGDIPALRRQIDAIDDQILALINRRLLAARDIGRSKQRTGTTVVDRLRENEIYQRLGSLNDGPLKTGGTSCGWRETWTPRPAAMVLPKML